MKHFSLFAGILGLLLVALSPLHAQDKEAMKRWKKKQKSTSPAQFKQMNDEMAEMEKGLPGLKLQVQGMSSSITETEQKIQDLRKKLQQLRKQRRTNSNSDAIVDAGGSSAQPNEDYTQGVIFRVQVGAYKLKELGVGIDVAKSRFRIETDENGVKKYAIGTFRDYWEADLFKKYMREMGVKDAWIVAYKDDRRVEITDVLEKDQIEAIRRSIEEGAGIDAGDGNSGGGTSTPQNETSPAEESNNGGDDDDW